MYRLVWHPVRTLKLLLQLHNPPPNKLHNLYNIKYLNIELMSQKLELHTMDTASGLRAF